MALNTPSPPASLQLSEINVGPLSVRLGELGYKITDTNEDRRLGRACCRELAGKYHTG